jgi:hypothetical protein
VCGTIQLDRIIAVAKERVEKYFEDPEDESAIKGFEGQLVYI